jgi:hypothetical protein
MFDDLDAQLASAIGGAFGEAAVLRPRVSVQYVERTAHPTVNPITVWGVFSAGPGETQMKGQARGAELVGTTRLASMTAEFWIAKAQVNELPMLPAKGDALALTSRAGSPVYSISMVQPSDMGDLNLILVREDQPLPPPPEEP